VQKRECASWLNLFGASAARLGTTNTLHCGLVDCTHTRTQNCKIGFQSLCRDGERIVGVNKKCKILSKIWPKKHFCSVGCLPWRVANPPPPLPVVASHAIRRDVAQFNDAPALPWPLLPPSEPYLPNPAEQRAAVQLRLLGLLLLPTVPRHSVMSVVRLVQPPTCRSQRHH
jgi:hypothetical protein